MKGLLEKLIVKTHIFQRLNEAIHKAIEEKLH
jgi:hypothetical protein